MRASSLLFDAYLEIRSTHWAFGFSPLGLSFPLSWFRESLPPLPFSLFPFRFFISSSKFLWSHLLFFLREPDSMQQLMISWLLKVLIDRENVDFRTLKGRMEITGVEWNLKTRIWAVFLSSFPISFKRKFFNDTRFYSASSRRRRTRVSSPCCNSCRRSKLQRSLQE